MPLIQIQEVQARSTFPWHAAGAISGGDAYVVVALARIIFAAADAMVVRRFF